MQDVPSERAVLAGLVKYGYDCYIDISDTINIDSFTDEDHQVIFKCVETIFEQDRDARLDWASMHAAARRLGCEDLLKRDYLRSLYNFPVDKSNVSKFAVIISKCKIIRDAKNVVANVGDSLNQLDGTEPVDTIVSTFENPIINFSISLTSGEDDGKLIGDGAVSLMERIGNDPRDMVGISTGYQIYDQAIGGGLQRKDANFIAARPKKGKSSIADNAGLHIAGKINIPVLEIDTEMSRERHQFRIIANLSGVSINDIKTGKYYANPRDRKAVLEAAKYLESIPFHYKNISGMDYRDVLSFIRRWIIKDVGFDENGNTNDAVIIYDYFKLCDSNAITKNLAETQVLGFQLMEMVNLIIKYDVSFLGFVQQNRQGINEDTTDTIAGTDRILMYCSSLSLFQAKTPGEIAEDGPNSGNRKLKVIESRDGEGISGEDWINMQFDGSINRIREIGLRSSSSKIANNPVVF